MEQKGIENDTSRSSHEERGLKYVIKCTDKTILSRSSHEERGLKYWTNHTSYGWRSRSSHEERGLKSFDLIKFRRAMRSLLSRGAWIEIFSLVHSEVICCVAPLTRSVD